MVRELRMLLAVWALGLAQKLWPKDDVLTHREIADLGVTFGSKR